VKEAGMEERNALAEQKKKETLTEKKKQDKADISRP